MPAFKEMDLDLVRKLLEGQENVLKAESTREEAYFRNCRCPICHGTTNETFVDPQNPFTPGASLPNKLLRCAMCRTEFNPRTGLVTRANPLIPVPG